MSTMKITRVEDVRVGDRVTVRMKDTNFASVGDEVTGTAVEYGDGVWVLGHSLVGRFDVEFVSATREVPDLPTEPGAYVDKRGAICIRDPSGWWYDGSKDQYVHAYPLGIYGKPLEARAPFTRLIPETELVEQRQKIAATAKDWGYYRLAGPIERGEI